MIQQNSEVLNKLFFTELQILVEKYNKIDEDTKVKIETVIEILQDDELQSYMMNNPDKLLEIVKYAEEAEIDEEVVAFFAWCNSKVKEISVARSSEYVEELKINKHVEIEEYLIYEDEKHLEEYARVILEDRLDQEYYVDKLFEKETIIEMWINRTTKEEMIDEIVDSGNLEETLELYPQEAFDICGIVYKFSEIE